MKHPIFFASLATIALMTAAPDTMHFFNGVAPAHAAPEPSRSASSRLMVQISTEPPPDASQLRPVPAGADASEAAPDSGVTPQQFIEQLGHTALMSLTKKNISRQEREARVRKVLEDNFDVQAIGRFVLGTHWRQASNAQREEYLRLFENMIVQTYTSRFENYAGQTLKVAGAVPAGEKDSIVSSQILQKDGPPINIEWRTRNENGKLRVVDVIVDRVSMSVTQRSDFSATIQSGGGDIEALLSSMRAHNQKPSL
jgi:phospholipid transport system substrate-binding protein